MRILLAVMAGLLVFSGVLIQVLRGELQDEHSVNAELQARLSVSQTAAQRPTGLSLQSENLGPADGGAITPVGSPTAVPEGNSSELEEVDITEMTRRSVSAARQIPEYLEAERVLGRHYIMGRFPGVEADLGLSRDEARRFYDLLRDTPALQEGPPDSALAALMGATRLAHWEEFQQTAVERRHAYGAVKTLATVGMPLSATQERSFVTAQVPERQRHAREIQLLADRIRVATAPEARRLSQQMDELEDDAEIRFVEAAAPSLNAEQLAQLREDAEAQRTKMRIMRRVIQDDP